MSFVPYGDDATVTLGVVAYGMTDRLVECIASLVNHVSEATFDVVCVINPVDREGTVEPRGLPAGVHVILPEPNLGWAGGLHLARHASKAQWMAWIQDDSQVLPGWLDAHLAAAATDARIGALGAVAVKPDGSPKDLSGGYALPGVSAIEWNFTDPTYGGNQIPAGVEPRDWLTSKGMLVRLKAWDDVGGTCARNFPIGRVDKEFTTHLRAHGWRLVVVPGAQVSHMGQQSAPMFFRNFMVEWLDPGFTRRWGDAVTLMSVSNGEPVEHDCHRHPTIASVERECMLEATRMVVPLGKYSSAAVANEREKVRDELWEQWTLEHADQAAAQVEAHARALEVMRSSRSWRVTAPLRWAGELARKVTGRRPR